MNRIVFFIACAALGLATPATAQQGLSLGVSPLECPLLSAPPSQLSMPLSTADVSQSLKLTLGDHWNNASEESGFGNTRGWPGIAVADSILEMPIDFSDAMSIPSGVLVCNRKTRSSLMPGNHAYLWDVTKGEGYGRSFDGTPEAGPVVDDCTPVIGSEGREQQIMRSIRESDRGFYFPVIWDCHDSVREAVHDAGLSYPGAPGGRLGPPRNDAPVTWSPTPAEQKRFADYEQRLNTWYDTQMSREELECKPVSNGTGSPYSGLPTWGESE